MLSPAGQTTWIGNLWAGVCVIRMFRIDITPSGHDSYIGRTASVTWCSFSNNAKFVPTTTLILTFFFKIIKLLFGSCSFGLFITKL